MLRLPEKPQEPDSFEAPSRSALASRTPRRVRWLRRALRGFIALMLGLMATYAGLNIYASIRLNRALERARAQGEPLTLPELAPPLVPREQNAAPLYEQADKALAYKGREEEQLLKLGQPGGGGDAQALATLARKQGAIALARRGSELPACRFPTDWSQEPMNILFPQYAKMFRLARLLSVQAVVQARRGDSAGALRDVRAVFAMSAHIKDEPVLIGFLVARSIERVANLALARVLEARPISIEEARSFEDSLPTVDWSASFRHAMLGERAFGLSALETMRLNPSQLQRYSDTDDGSGTSPVARLMASPLGVLWAPVVKLDQAEILRLWEMHIQAITPMPVPMPPERIEAIDQALKDTPFYAVLTKILFPVFARAYQHREGVEVGARQRQTALALAAYRHAHGSYPARLEEAAPLRGAMPPDLYAPQLLRYKSDGRSFRLYSIGPNRVDDGGRDAQGRDLEGESASTGQTSTDDIVWNPASR